jgi:hypothetical protein
MKISTFSFKLLRITDKGDADSHTLLLMRGTIFCRATLYGRVEKVQKAGHCDPAFGGGSNLTPYGSMG